MDEIPVIDLAPYFTGGDVGKAAVADQVGRACTEIGFLVIANHGVAAEAVRNGFAASRAFFDLPLAEKRRHAPDDPSVPRGYTGLASKSLARTLGQDAPPDLREQFFIGPLVDERAYFAGIEGAAKFYGPNLWPDAPADYEPAMRRLYGEMAGLAGALMRIFALALGLGERFFDDKIDHHFSTLPSNHYPPPPSDRAPEQVRCGAHTDFGSLTILAIDDAPGCLQVEMPGHGWRDVRPAPGTLVVNLGDMMARWTNERWRSTLHRVVNPPEALADGARRQSIGFFLHPNFDTIVAALPGCVAPGEAPKYPPILAGGHMAEKLERRVV